MRKLLLCLPILTALISYAQKGDWDMSARGGFGWGGPKTTFNKAMIETNFNQTHSGWLGSSKYPRVRPSFALLVKGSKRFKENAAFFVMGGLTAAGAVDGFSKEKHGNSGWIDLSSGTRVGVAYQVLQLSAGLEHRLPNSNVKFGYGPSVYYLQYNNTHFTDEKYNAIVPGLALSGTIPLGKQKHKMGVAVVTDVNLALPANLKPLHHHYTMDGASQKVAFVRKTKASMTQGMIGLALTLRS